MIREAWVGMIAISTPVVANLADTAIAGSGTGVWAAAGAFLGQIVASTFVKKRIEEHTQACANFARKEQ